VLYITGDHVSVTLSALYQYKCHELYMYRLDYALSTLRQYDHCFMTLFPFEVTNRFENYSHRWFGIKATCCLTSVYII